MSFQPVQSDMTDEQEAVLYQHTEKIRQGIERAEHLVEQLLTLAKLAPQQVKARTHHSD